MENLNLRDMNTILDALVIAYEKAQNEDKALTLMTISKVGEMRAKQIAWLYKEYSETNA